MDGCEWTRPHTVRRNSKRKVAALQREAGEHISLLLSLLARPDAEFDSVFTMQSEITKLQQLAARVPEPDLAMELAQVELIKAWC